MKMFYHQETKHLIAVPFKNGTTYISNNVSKYKLLEVTYDSFFKMVIKDTEKKTFIYRDPCLRLLSFYNGFIYGPTKLNKAVNLEKNPKDYLAIKKQKPNELFNIVVRGNNLLSDLVMSKSNIEKYYMTNAHTMPQYEYFKKYDETVQDYEIVSNTQYDKWLKLTFADMDFEFKKSGIDDTQLIPSNFRDMQIIQNMCYSLYEEDYKFLEPNIIYL